MSDEVKIGRLAATVRNSAAASATASARHTFTGRSITANQDHALADSWAKCDSTEAFRGHDAFSRFKAEVAELKRVTGAILQCFRGRNLPLEDIPSSLQMGPPPSGHAGPGRYNVAGRPVLYLCDSVEGVLREVEDDGRATWIQQFSVNPTDLNLIDTRLSTDSAFANQVFWFAESSDTRIAGGKPTFSQFVAQFMAELCDGMLVRGVRGEKGLHYSNIVLFRPMDNWQTWLLKGSEPVRHRPSDQL